MTRPLFTLPIPASRATVPTGYGYVMPDQNGWSRSLHFQAAWAVVLTGLVYAICESVDGPLSGGSGSGAGGPELAGALGGDREVSPPRAAGGSGGHSYNVMQRTAYLGVIFVLFPLVIWTGLAMSPAVTSAVPAVVILLGGRQTARTLHFFVSWALVLFLVVHVTMIVLAGFWSRMRAMIRGVLRDRNRAVGERR